VSRIEIERPRGLNISPGAFRPKFNPPTLLRVVGLDLSLTSTGMSDGNYHWAVQTRPDTCLEDRLDTLVRAVVKFVLADDEPANLVVIEAPAFSRTGPGHEELAALRIMVRHRLWRLKIPYALVPPSTLKKYTFGHGVASKPQMAACVAELYGWDPNDVTVSHGRYDIADALALAAMGYDHVGQPIGTGRCRDSLNAVQWPELVSD
jgi:Holliday junction resolvasome RuvABC endonuclease subunit